MRGFAYLAIGASFMFLLVGLSINLRGDSSDSVLLNKVADNENTLRAAEKKADLLARMRALLQVCLDFLIKEKTR